MNSPSKKFMDLTGAQFGRLTVLSLYTGQDKNPKKKYWECQCQCGNKCIVESSNLKTGNTTSCGCYHSEQIAKQSRKENRFSLDEDYGVGFTANGNSFYFDKEDYDLIKGHCWHITHYGYVATRDRVTKQIVLLHRLVLGYYGDFDIDHINGDKTDNRKENLRVCSHQENMMNQKKRKSNTSGITGVSYDNNRQCWRAYIKVDGKMLGMKRFIDKNDAIQYRKELEQQYFGEYAPISKLEVDF